VSQFFGNGSFGQGGEPFTLSFEAKTGERLYVLVLAIVKGGAGYNLDAAPALYDIEVSGGLDLADVSGLSPTAPGVYSFEAVPEPGVVAQALAVIGGLAWVARPERHRVVALGPGGRNSESDAMPASSVSTSRSPSRSRFSS
jgi:hypothetical protein